MQVTDAFWEAAQCNSSSNRRFRTHVVSIFRVPEGEGGSTVMLRGITVVQPLHTGMLIMVKEHCLLGWFHGRCTV
jgi:hypothetical protein